MSILSHQLPIDDCFLTMSFAPCLTTHPEQPNRRPDDDQIRGAFLFRVCSLLTRFNLRFFFAITIALHNIFFVDFNTQKQHLLFINNLKRKISLFLLLKSFSLTSLVRDLAQSTIQIAIR